MAVTAEWFGLASKNVLEGDVALATDTIKVALLANTYVFDKDGHEFAHLATAAWVASTAYAVGDYVVPTASNGHVYKATVAGTSGTTEPTWPTTGGTVVDGTVTWEDQGTLHLGHHETSGTGYTAGGETVTTPTATYDAVNNRGVFDGDDVAWLNSTITARFAVVYVAGVTPGTDDYLLGIVDFGVDESSSSGDFTITWSSEGILRIAT